ncbi:hypothetical protein [Pseudomonas fluorescens]|uniref:hypothetical protein n=1 Tax=Pseudomonas fluorescens TaxID=294 RepID=UPI003D002C82
MESNTSLTTTLYLFFSLIGFLAFRAISKNFSGANFKPKWFWICFALSMLWGVAQLNVARYGYVLFFPFSKDLLVSNYLVRWIAFISAIFQTVCIPSKEEPRRWFSRK